MMPLRRQILINAFKLFDLAVMGVCFLAAFCLLAFPLNTLSIDQVLSIHLTILYYFYLIVFFILWRIIFSVFKLYSSRRFSIRWYEAPDILKATTVGVLVLFAGGKILGIETITLPFIFTFWCLTSLITFLSRAVLRFVLRWIRTRGRNLRFVVILGMNQEAGRLAKMIKAKPELGYRFIGFFYGLQENGADFETNDFQFLGGFEEFISIVREQVVDEVWITLPVESYYMEISPVIEYCRSVGIIMRFFPNSGDSGLAYVRTEQLEGNSVFTQYHTPMAGWQEMIKRFFDIVAALVLLLLLSPLFILCAVLIKTTSPGPVFFIQERIGLNRRRFNLYKFRTMVENAEGLLPELEALNEVPGPVFKIMDDPRVTKVGRLLRKTSIDELPQLINILKGDMSLVGPRPLPVRDFSGLYEDGHFRRFSVPPGLTCLWQVNGRSTIPFEKWMELDLQYIDNWSLWLDFKILFRTIPEVFRGSGAA